MTDTPRPLDPEHVDELLSADLDGELAGAASDLGYDADQVRAQIASDAELRARRDTLDRARHELGSFSPLDDVTSARLRAAARAELRQPNRTRLYAIGGAIAAAVAIVVAIVAVVSSQSTSTHESSAASAAVTLPATSTPAAHVAAGAGAAGIDFGAVPNVDALVAHVSSSNRLSAPSSLAYSNSATALPSSPAATPKEAGEPATSASPCGSVVQGAAGTNARLLERGNATLGGQAVSVWVYARNGAPDLLVVADPGCNVVAARPLGTTSH